MYMFPFHEVQPNTFHKVEHNVDMTFYKLQPNVLNWFLLFAEFIMLSKKKLVPKRKAYRVISGKYPEQLQKLIVN